MENKYLQKHISIRLRSRHLEGFFVLAIIECNSVVDRYLKKHFDCKLYLNFKS